MPGLLENVMLDVGAHEPWPNDVLLYQPYPIEQILLPDNANCLATQAFLHMCGLPFKVEHRSNAEFMSPSGKVPFIKCGAFLVSELEPIVQFVGNKGISLTENLDAEQKSDLRAYMSLIFSVLMNAELYICWCDKKTYNDVTKVRNGSVFPWPLNYFQTWSKKSSVIRKLKLHGWHQKTLGSVYQEVQNCCQALSERLEGKEFFFGSKPTEIDALIFGHIFAIFLMSKDIAFVFLIVKNYPNLTNHSNRIYQAYFENENFNFGNGTINQGNFISKNLDSNNAIKNNSFETADCTNESKNNNIKPTSAPKDKILPRREPRPLRKTRFNDDIPKKKESSDSSPEQYNQLANVRSTDSSSICSEIEISTIADNLNSNLDIQLNSEIDNHIDSTQENKPSQNSLSTLTHNNDNDTTLRKLETELTYFNSNLQPQSQSTLSDLSEINKSENCFNALTTATPNSYNENKSNENSLHSFKSSSDHKITSNNNNTSDSIIPESKYYSVSIDSKNLTEEEKIQPYPHLDDKKSNSNTIIPDSKYNSVTVTESDENDLQSCESVDRKPSSYSNSTIGSVDSKYDLISFDSQSSQP